jgi:hypothetical protein
MRQKIMTTAIDNPTELANTQQFFYLNQNGELTIDFREIHFKETPKLLDIIKPFSDTYYPDDDMYFGLAIQIIDAENSIYHLGALYRLDGVLMLGQIVRHFAAEELDADDDICVMAGDDDYWYWMKLNVSEKIQIRLAETFHSWIVENKNTIPFSVTYTGNPIFKNNRVVTNTPGDGVTCSTIMIELFKEVGIQLIDIDTWEERDGDKEWGKWCMSKSWNSSSMSEAHVKAQEDSIMAGKMVRIQPIDIITAAYLRGEGITKPLNFDLADKFYNWIARGLLLDYEFKSSLVERAMKENDDDDVPIIMMS